MAAQAQVARTRRVLLGDRIERALAGDSPLVTIRFDKPNVSYESALYTAVKGALARATSAS